MSKISLLLLLLLFSAVTSAHPGDDIWDNIRDLSARSEIALSSIEEIKNDNQVLRSMIDSKVNQHHIGEEYRGGIIFYIDDRGEHGLIASKIDVNEKGVQWRNGSAGNKVTNARGDGIRAGETNTRLIIAQQTIDNQNGQFAALMAANFQVLGDGVTPCKTPVKPSFVCYGGWYLPSAYELQLLHNNLHQRNLSLFAPEFYWSSTEENVSNAWLQNFSTGEMISSSKANTIGRIRAISSF